MATVKAQICEWVSQGEARAWRRPEFLTLADPASVDEALRALVREGRIAEIGYALYVPLGDGGKLAVEERHYELGAGELDDLPPSMRRAWARVVKRYGGVMKILSDL